MLKRYKEALVDINKGIALGAKRPHIAYYDRAIADEALGDIRGAYEDYKKAVELEPDFALATEQLPRFKVVRKPTSTACRTVSCQAAPLFRGLALPQATD